MREALAVLTELERDRLVSEEMTEEIPDEEEKAYAQMQWNQVPSKLQKTVTRRKIFVVKFCCIESRHIQNVERGMWKRHVWFLRRWWKRDANNISWNSKLSGYTQNGQASKALLLFDEMRGSDCEPLPCYCMHRSWFQLVLIWVLSINGRKFHDLIMDNRTEIDTNLSNALVYMDAKCGS
ncbi:hypothetical protein OIU79_025838 [Salix purpurea]|uniref:Pentatricopeptide repeat-containing protein n=1 Tax=Salix purpurea TaxID=77065 RepID=A0A9Q0W632_SALPP|nr:hypothetical protein OIU79_025838 [Salix purpurea]